MADFRASIITILSANSTLTTLMAGGIFSSETLDRRGIMLNTAPKLSDGVRINPFIVVRVRGSGRVRPHNFGKMTNVEIYYYQDTKYDKIETAKRLVKDLLHQKTLSATDNETFGYMEWVNDIGENVEEELGQTPMSMSRFTIISRDKEI